MERKRLLHFSPSPSPVPPDSRLEIVVGKTMAAWLWPNPPFLINFSLRSLFVIISIIAPAISFSLKGSTMTAASFATSGMDDRFPVITGFAKGLCLVAITHLFQKVSTRKSNRMFSKDSKIQQHLLNMESASAPFRLRFLHEIETRVNDPRKGETTDPAHDFVAKCDIS